MAVTLTQFFSMPAEQQRAFAARLTQDQLRQLARDAFNFAHQALQTTGSNMALRGGVAGFSLGNILSGITSIASVVGPTLASFIPGAAPILTGLTNLVTTGANAAAAFTSARPLAQPQTPPQNLTTNTVQAPAKDNTALFVGLGVLALIAFGGRR